MSWLDGLFQFSLQIRQAGTALKQRFALNFLSPFTAVDNPTTGASDIGFSASAAGVSTATASTLVLRDGSANIFCLGLDLGQGSITNAGAVTFNANVAPGVNQTQLAGTGANPGTTLTIRAQQGQAQTGGAANNNGGILQLLGGLAGTGGGGAAGALGQVQITGSLTVITGGAQIPAGSLNLTAMTAPASPAAGFVLFVDTSDSKLKAKSSGGTVTILANP